MRPKGFQLDRNIEDNMDEISKKNTWNISGKFNSLVVQSIQFRGNQKRYKWIFLLSSDCVCSMFKKIWKDLISPFVFLSLS